MERRTCVILVVWIMLVACSRDLVAASRAEQVVDDFTLRSHLGREWSLSEFSDDNFVVIAFLGTECPLAKLYGPRLDELRERFGDQGVAFIGISANTQDSVTDLAAYAERHKVRFPILKDVGNRVADAMGAQRTPEVFLIDRDRKVRYHGRIDDQYGVGVLRDRAHRRDLAIAIEELLAGKGVSVPETPPVGCHIGRIKRTVATGDITYSNQISRILNERCVECHRQGEIAPFPLTRYDETMGWGDTIVEVIEDQRMPPWFANPAHGRFRNDARLTHEEKELIAKWVANGMPEGDPAQLPPPPEFTAGWRIPKPDQVFHMRDASFLVPAQGVIDYQHFVVDPGWDEDKYIYAAEARPDNTSVVHHILVYVIPPERRNRPDLRKTLVGYAPGSTPVHLHDGAAIRVPARSKLLFQMHYTPNGYEQDDRSYVGVCFIDKQNVKTLINGRLAINTDFRIPANESHHVVRAKYRFRRDELLLAMTPHMHLRGKSFRYEATYPDGQKEILLDVPNYDFNWQLKYILDEPKVMPKGTTIQCTAAYDNSEDNLVNPDPGKSVRWGDQSWEEMMIGFFNTIPVATTRASISRNVAIDPSGAWAWKRPMGRKTVNDSLVLKLEEGRLSGILKSDGRSIPIQDAAMDGDRLTFHVELPRLAGITIDFDARVSEDRIKGEAVFAIESIGKTQTFPWVARRTETESDDR